MFLNLGFNVFIYIILFILFIFVFINLYLFLFYKNLYFKKRYRNYYYQKIYRYVLNNDYLLINNFKHNYGKKDEIYIDHIIFGKKYIYLIYDNYYFGCLNGKIDDNYLLFYAANSKTSVVNNPIKKSLDISKNFKKHYNLDSNLVKTIVLFNNGCLLDIKDESFNKTAKDYIKINNVDLIKSLKEFENSNISDINQEEILKTCHCIAKESEN